MAELRRISNHFLSGVDNAKTATNSDDTPIGDAPTPSPTEQREIIDISDDSVKGDTPLQTNPPTKKRSRPRVSDTPHKINAASKPWGTILAKETFQLDDFLQRAYNSGGSDRVREDFDINLANAGRGGSPIRPDPTRIRSGYRPLP